jgi:acetolactate synthase I/II/III large subunit
MLRQKKEGRLTMAKMSGAEAMVRMLQLHSVKYLFGLCGDTSLPFYDALFRMDHGMRHILTRDERSAGYMADAYARVTGNVGVCEGPSGGGATYIIPGLIEANESSSAVLAITTDISTSSQGRYTLTELDQRSLFRPLTKWNEVIDRAERLPGLVRTAFRAMTTGRPGAAHLTFPFNVQTEELSESEIWCQPDTGIFPTWRFLPNPDDIARAARALAGARCPLFICGGGVVISGAPSELARLAEMLGAPVATTISGQGSLGEMHPLCLGVVGSNGGTPASRNVIEDSDLVVFVGCRAGSVTTERWRYPRLGTPVIHIDVDPMVIGANYPTTVALVGDAKLTLKAIADELCSNHEIQPAQGASIVERARAEKIAAFSKLAANHGIPILPERVVKDLHEILPGDAVVVCDPGTPCPYFSAFYEFLEAGRHFISNRAHGALGYAMSAAVGAYFGRPRTKTVAIMGDGSFGFTAGELETIVRYKVPVLMIVLSNSVYGWIKAGQKSGYGGRYFSVDFSRTDHAMVARSFGVPAWKVEDPSQLRSVLSAAAEESGPALVDVIVQPL